MKKNKIEDEDILFQTYTELREGDYDYIKHTDEVNERMKRRRESRR